MIGEYSNSLETKSASLMDFSVNIGFEDINYRVRPAVFMGGRKTILKDVCGAFNSGELTVIVGQSGAGKSSLLDILAGYTKPTSGRICVNGQLRNEDKFRKQSCYLMQDDQAHHMLTVHECLSFAAELRLGNHVGNEQKNKRVASKYRDDSSSRRRDNHAAAMADDMHLLTVVGFLFTNLAPTNKHACEDLRTFQKAFFKAAFIIIQRHCPYHISAFLYGESGAFIILDGSRLLEDAITEIITSLGLATERNTKAGNLSGGQRKRLGIGLELITDPAVMFLDEPTSGVDSSITKQLIYLLHQLSRQGRTVVITMHQPSALLLPLIDRLYAMVDGRCSYIGSVSSLLPYLQQANLICPPYHNPIDFLIEKSVDNPNELVLASENGKTNKWSTFDETGVLFTEKYLITCSDICLTILPSRKEHQTNKILLGFKSTYSTTFWKQFTTLTRRSLMFSWRDPTLTIMMIVTHCAMGSLIGILYNDIGKDAIYVRDNFNMLFFNITYLMFTAMTAVTINFPLQIPVVRREHFNGWYSTGAYFIATLVSALPMQTFCSLIYACVVYWLSGQPQEIIRFLTFSWTLVLMSYVAIAIGLLNGAIFTVKGGVISGPLFILPFTLFSGYFLRYSDVPFALQWIYHVSFVKHGLVGLVLSIFGMERQRLPCSDTYCHYTMPKQLLKDIEMLNESYVLVVGGLFANGFTLLLLSYLILTIRLKNKW